LAISTPGLLILEPTRLELDAGGVVAVVNGKKIFCKGANWIPADALPSRQTPKRYEQLLSDAVTANKHPARYLVDYDRLNKGVVADKALGILDQRLKVFHLRGSYR